MTSWDEIKLLAADLRRVQLGQSSKRLSNRNCVELVNKLISTGRLEVITTINSKDYVTPEYLLTQIKNEVIANGGRVSLTEIQQALGVDFQTVEDYANRLVASSPSLSICLGQLISKEYLTRAFIAINESLQRKGKISISEITRQYDLPTDFLADAVVQQVGRHIEGFIDTSDASVIYTHAYLNQQTAILRGALSGCTRIISLKKLVTDFDLASSLVFKCFDQLRLKNSCRGSIVGGHYVDRAVYMPEKFMEKLNAHLAGFYQRNGYLEYGYIRKFRIGDHGAIVAAVLSRLGQTKSAVHLKNCVISENLFNQIEADADTTLSQSCWLDVNAVVPTVFSDADVELISNMLAKSHKSWIRPDQSSFFTDGLVHLCVPIFDDMIAEKAEKEGPLVGKAKFQLAAGQSTVPAGKKKVGGKSKKKKTNYDQEDEDDLSTKGGTTVFMSESEIAERLKFSSLGLEDCPQAILEEVSDRLYSILNAKYQAQVDSILLKSTEGQRKSRGEIAEKITSLYSVIHLSDVAADQFDAIAENIAEQLRMFLLRTLATDLAHLALIDFANLPDPMENSKKARDSAIKELASPAKEYFERLMASLNEKNLNSFYDAVDKIALPNICSLNLRFPDKKNKVILMTKYEQELRTQLEANPEPASGLLLCCLLLFARYTEQMLHASGKFVPQIVDLLMEKLPPDLGAKLTRAQADVVHFIRNQQDPGAQERAAESVAQLQACV
ncbi:core histone H2A:H2B:H3:H4 family protein [Trichuris trichiura]|uniref:E3 UFM1-protein ligase 1 homolog n=1 Tax=Trichuris trichiura TaxID=36087 RepID=A0A077ZB69_TRITR|nr:core histone H2A:H2B:H3:H4 family protein [Trichuris trichiura]